MSSASLDSRSRGGSGFRLWQTGSNGEVVKFVGLLTGSTGKKLFMALTGLCFLIFLIFHLLGNLTLFAGAPAFNSYVSSLEALGPVVLLAEAGLAALAIVHVGTGLVLFYGNIKARPVRYRLRRSSGGRTAGSATMPYTGLAILFFLFIHLIDFTLADKGGATLYDIVVSAFSNPFHALFYVAMMGVVALHVSHGFWSLLQTLGLSHPKYTPPIRFCGILLSLLLGVGFGLIPIFLYFSA